MTPWTKQFLQLPIRLEFPSLVWLLSGAVLAHQLCALNMAANLRPKGGVLALGFHQLALPLARGYQGYHANGAALVLFAHTYLHIQVGQWLVVVVFHFHAFSIFPFTSSQH